MKKEIIVGLMVVCMLALGGCGQSDSSTATVATENVQGQQAEVVESPMEDDAEINDMATQDAQAPAQENSDETNDVGSSTNTLVVYFSRIGEQYGVGVIDKGNTAIVADMIVEATGADSYEILPKEDYYPYTYDELCDVAKQELNDNARPAIKDAAPDLSGYDVIFIGAPVWWGDWPMIMYTFFEENADALAGKRLIPFSTHAGSGLSGFDSKLSKALPDSTVGTGLAIAGTDTQNDQGKVRQNVNDWLSELGY